MDFETPIRTQAGHLTQITKARVSRGTAPREANRGNVFLGVVLACPLVDVRTDQRFYGALGGQEHERRVGRNLMN